MNINESFAKLQIEPTKEEKAIKAAYRAQLVHNNPEDNPEGFKALREAYEQAMEYASRQEEPAVQEEDHTPSGMWVQEAAGLYGRLSTRCSVARWRELFERDAFVSLDDGEACRDKLMIFMMDHVYFPDSVWELIASKLAFRKDAARLKERFPQDYVDFLVRRCMSKENLDYTLFQGPDDADYDTYIRYYNAAWDALESKDYAQVEQTLAQAAATGISHPYIEFVRAAWERETGAAERARERLERLHTEYPDNPAVLYQLAMHYDALNDTERVLEYLCKLKEHDRNHYMSNYRLAQIYTERGDYEAARECICLVLRRGDNDAMRDLRQKVNQMLEPTYRARWEQEHDVAAAKELAWCLWQDQRPTAAQHITEAIEEMVPDSMKSDYLGLCTRIAMELGQLTEVLELSEQWLTFLKEHPDDRGEEEEYQRNLRIAHSIRISAFHQLGRCISKNYGDAIEEYGQYCRLAEPAPEVMIEMCQIYLEKGDYDQSMKTARELLNYWLVQYAYALMMEVHVKQRNMAGVIRCGMQCMSRFPDYARAYEEVALVYYDTGQQEQLNEVLERAKSNHVASVYLDAYAFEEKTPTGYPIREKLENFEHDYLKKLTMSGDMEYYRQGYPVITHYLMLCPSKYVLNMRGLFSMAAKDYDAALADFYKILERDPADYYALNNIGCVLKYQGKYENAIPYFMHAVLYLSAENDPNPKAMPLGNLAHTYELMGEYTMAAATYRLNSREVPSQQGNISAMKRIVLNLARGGMMKSALDYCEENGKNDDDKFNLFYHALLYGAKFENAWGLNGSGRYKHLAHFFWKRESDDGRERRERMSRYIWSFAYQGDYTAAIHAIDRSLEWTNSTRTQVDLKLNRLFFLCLNQYAHRFTLRGRSAPADDINTLRRSLQAAAFFYKERYVAYAEFMIALFGAPDTLPAALQALEDAPRCRLCNHAQCQRLILARAICACESHDREEALALLTDLQTRQPYNIYAYVFLKALKK